MKQRVLTVTEAERDENKALWVLNTTKDDGTSRRSNVLLCIQVGTETATIPVPYSWLPFNLSDHAPKEAIIRSIMFRRGVTLKQLAIIDEDTAFSLLERPGAKEEMERLENLSSNRVDDILREEQQRTQTEFNKTIAEKAETNNRAFANVPPEEIGVNAQVVQIMNTAENEKSAMTGLRVVSSSLNKIDFNYISKKAIDNNWNKIKKAVNARVKELEDMEDSEEYSL